MSESDKSKAADFGVGAASSDNKASTFFPVPLNSDLVAKAKAAADSTVSAHSKGQADRALGGLKNVVEKIANAGDNTPATTTIPSGNGVVVVNQHNEVAEQGKDLIVKTVFDGEIVNPDVPAGVSPIASYNALYEYSNPLNTDVSTSSNMFKFLNDIKDKVVDLITTDDKTENKDKAVIGTRMGSVPVYTAASKVQHANQLYADDASMSTVVSAILQRRTNRQNEEIALFYVPPSVASKLKKAIPLLSKASTRLSDATDGGVYVNLVDVPATLKDVVARILLCGDYTMLSNAIPHIAALLHAMGDAYCLKVHGLPHGVMSKDDFKKLKDQFPGLFTTVMYKNSTRVLSAKGKSADIAAQSAVISAFITNTLKLVG